MCPFKHTRNQPFNPSPSPSPSSSRPASPLSDPSALPIAPATFGPQAIVPQDTFTINRSKFNTILTTLENPNNHLPPSPSRPDDEVGIRPSVMDDLLEVMSEGTYVTLEGEDALDAQLALACVEEWWGFKEGTKTINGLM